MNLIRSLVILSVGLAGCSEESPRPEQKAPKPRNPQGKTLSRAALGDPGMPGGAPSAERIKSLLSRMAAIGGGFQFHKPEEIAEILNEAEFLEGSGGFIASYENYLSEISDIEALVDALAPLNEAPWKAKFMERIFYRSNLVTPEHLLALASVCKSVREQEILGEGASVRIGKSPAADQLALAQSFLDASTSDHVSKPIVGASVNALMSQPVEGLETWLLGLPPEVAEAGDAVLLRHYAEKDPETGAATLQRIIDLGQTPRSHAAVMSFGKAYAMAHPQHALEWANRLPDSFSHARLQTLVFAFSPLAKDNPAHAKEVLRTILDPAAKKRLEGILTRN